MVLTPIQDQDTKFCSELSLPWYSSVQAKDFTLAMCQHETNKGVFLGAYANKLYFVEVGSMSINETALNAAKSIAILRTLSHSEVSFLGPKIKEAQRRVTEILTGGFLFLICFFECHIYIILCTIFTPS